MLKKIYESLKSQAETIAAVLTVIGSILLCYTFGNQYAIYAYLISAAYVASRMVLPALAAAFAQSHTGSFILSRLVALSMISLCGWLIYASLYLAVNPLIFFPLIFLPQLSASIFAYTQYTGDIIMGHEAVKNMNPHRKRSAQNYINEKMYYLLNATSSALTINTCCAYIWQLIFQSSFAAMLFLLVDAVIWLGIALSLREFKTQQPRHLLQTGLLLLLASKLPMIILPSFALVTYLPFLNRGIFLSARFALEKVIAQIIPITQLTSCVGSALIHSNALRPNAFREKTTAPSNLYHEAADKISANKSSPTV